MPDLQKLDSAKYSQWANQNSYSLFLLSSVLIIIFVPIFHWIMPSLDKTVTDSLAVRLIATFPAVLLFAFSFYPPFRKHILLFQCIQVSAMLCGMFWVSGIAGFSPFYLTASLLGIVGAALTLMTRAQVLWITFFASLSFLSFFYLHQEAVSQFVFMFYASAGVITVTLAIVKVLSHEREFLLREALAKTMTDLAKVRTQKFMLNEQLFLGELSSSVAHEINNPLCTLRFSLERLEEAAAKKLTPQPDLFHRALRQEHKIKTFIDHLLFFSGVHFVGSKSLNISKITQLTTHILRPILIKNQSILLANISSEDSVLKSQPQDIAQILYQLVKIATEIMIKSHISHPRIALNGTHLNDTKYSFRIEFEYAQDCFKESSSLLNSLPEPQRLRLETVQHLVERNQGNFEFYQDRTHAHFQVVLS